MIKFFATSLFIAIGLAAHAQWPFQNEAQHAGVISRHLDHKIIGGGVVIFDYNNDGHEDLYFTGGIYVDKLFTNKGNGKFEDISIKTGIFDALKGFKTGGGGPPGGYSQSMITLDEKGREILQVVPVPNGNKSQMDLKYSKFLLPD